MRHFKIFAVVALPLVASCSFKVGNADEFAQQVAPAVPGKIEIAFIGNSITLHNASAAKQWGHDGGMAASDEVHDYAHDLTRMLHIDKSHAYIRNFYPFET